MRHWQTYVYAIQVYGTAFRSQTVFSICQSPRSPSHGRTCHASKAVRAAFAARCLTFSAVTRPTAFIGRLGFSLSSLFSVPPPAVTPHGSSYAMYHDFPLAVL